MNPFYNREQRRLRALWRIIIQGILYFIGTALVGFVAGVIGALVLTASGKITLEQMSDPQVIVALVTQPGGWLFTFTAFGRVVIMLLAFLLAGWLLDKRKFVDFGFHFSRQWWLDLIFGLGLGAALMIMIFVIEWAFGWVSIKALFYSPDNSFVSGWLAALVAFIAVGIYEEMLSRGYHLRNLAEGLNWGKLGTRGGLWLAYLLSSLVFGFMHFGNPNTSWVSTLNLVVAGLFLGLGFVLTGELALSIGLHITWNFFQGNIFGFPVSGTYAGTSLVTIQQKGPDLLTGGAFGPEAGLIGIFAILVGAGLILLYVHATRRSLQVHTRLAEYQPLVKKIENNLPETIASIPENQIQTP